jgi:5-methyltetrahydrofolate--homocysteine methyltransferase
MRNFLNELNERVLVYDGSKGFLLQQLGLKGGECPELWNVNFPEKIKNLYKMYKDSGADVIQTNTFQGNRLVLSKYGVGDRTYELNFEAAKLAKEVMGEEGFVSASIGPLGILMKPFGDLDFKTAFEVFQEQVKALVAAGVDIIHFETFTDVSEMRAAILAAKTECELPIIATLAYEANGKTLMGTDPFTAAITLKSIGANIVGANCSFGSEGLVPIIEEMHKAVGMPICVKPNAGLPEVINGKTSYSLDAKRFSEFAQRFIESGGRLIGGCCGTTPEHIDALKCEIKKISTPQYDQKDSQIITSATRFSNIENENFVKIQFDFSDLTGLITAFENEDEDYIVDIVLDLSDESEDAVIFDTSGLELKSGMLAWLIDISQSYLKAPFIFNTDNPVELDKALMIYKGRAAVIIKNNLCNKELLIKTAKTYGSIIFLED